jgi:hypothetical protein
VTRRSTLVLCAAATLAAAAPYAQDTTVPTPGHHMVTAEQVKFGPGPAGLPPGGKMAVVSGDPGKPGPFTVRAWMPAGYKVPPHWHPTDEHVTVLSGTLAMGMGDAWDDKALMDLPAGGFAGMTANTRHFALARTEVVIQVHGTGPFDIVYVNAADDPRRAAAPKK